MYLTNSGIPAKYFSGMAINKRSKKEMPSSKADKRRCCFIELIFEFRC
jgi:hypothetical protein